MKITTDYHMHSTFSPDGDDSPEVLCQQALRLGLTEIAITEHAEWHPSFPEPNFPRVTAYFEAVDRCRSRFEPLGLTVHTGVELGNPHQYQDLANSLLAEYNFDVVLGSLHYVRDKNIHLKECFEGRHPDDVYATYFAELAQIVTSFEFDIVTHFDRILWRGTLLGASFDPHKIEPVIRETLATVARHGRALELNTHFLAHKPGWNSALVTMFHWFLQEGGTQVTVNSDAHRASEVGRYRDIAGDILIRAGFKLPEQLFKIGASPKETETLSLVDPTF